MKKMLLFPFHLPNRYLRTLSNPVSHSRIMASHAAIKPAWCVAGTFPGCAPSSSDGEVEHITADDQSRHTMVCNHV